MQANSPFIRLISRIAVLGVPSSASRWISLSATISEVVLDLPYMVSRSAKNTRCSLRSSEYEGMVSQDPPCRPSRTSPRPASPVGRNSWNEHLERVCCDSGRKAELIASNAELQQSKAQQDKCGSHGVGQMRKKGDRELKSRCEGGKAKVDGRSRSR